MQNVPSPSTDLPLYEWIYAIVRQIPPGRVASYGQIAEITSASSARTCSARLVGYAMAALRSGDHPDVPWQRVINRQGKISITDPAGGYMQRKLLIEEGVVFNDQDQVNFEDFGWLGQPGQKSNWG